MRHFLALLLAALLLCALIYPAGATEGETSEEAEEPSEEEPAEPAHDAGGLSLSAECAVLVDAASGRVLYEKNAEQTHLIASTTKIMTALVVLERMDNLDEMVTIQREWTGIEGSSMYLEPDVQVSIRGLLYGLMLNSGNDAATALANYCAGDEATFVSWMNECAREIGMTNTHFANPHGLDAEDHYSTAYDMALLMIEAMKNPDFREISHARYINIDGFELYYHNKLLSLYEYCISGKTGYTMAAGRTLVTASEKDGQLLVAVTLNDPDDWNDHIAMYEYGYNNFAHTNLCTRGECAAIVPMADSPVCLPVYFVSSFDYLVPQNSDLAWEVQLPKALTGSVTKGAQLGQVVYTLDGAVIGRIPLIAGAYADFENKEVSYEWKSGYKKSCLLAGLYPDGQPNGTYRMEGLLSTAFLHTWA